MFYIRLLTGAHRFTKRAVKTSCISDKQVKHTNTKCFQPLIEGHVKPTTPPITLPPGGVLPNSDAL